MDQKTVVLNGNPDITITFLHDYPDRNIFLKILTTNPAGETNEKIVENVLFDPEGNWLKSEGNDDFVLTRSIELDITEEGVYRVKVTQFTRREQLCDIESAKIFQ